MSRVDVFFLRQRLHRQAVNKLCIRVYLPVTGTFRLGGVVGALLFRLMQEHTLLIPAVLAGLCGVRCGVYGLYAKNAADGPRAS